MNMKKIVHPIYKDYAEQPFISPGRDMESWEKMNGLFPYGIIEKKQMQRLSEGLLPGHIVMLWRIHFNNFTNETVIPQYFEYRYGVDSEECIETLIKLGYAKVCSAKDSLNCLNMRELKEILKKLNLQTTGKKENLLSRVIEYGAEQELEALFFLRKYGITSPGEEVLKKYDSIIQKHGPKM